MMRILGLLTISFAGLATGICSIAQADPILQWNAVASDTLLVDQNYQNPGMASRTLAMVNLAMYDSVMGITGTHVPFYQRPLGPDGASAEAAAVQAAYRVLSSIYPAQQSMLDNARFNSLLAIPDSPNKTAGVNYGDSIATWIVNHRLADGFDSMVNYVPQGGPGRWEPDPLNPTQQAWGPGWGELEPFGITDTDSFLPPPPPALTSQQYADSFNEVKELGALNSATRTPDQTEIGLFWAYDRLGMGTPLRLYNAIVRTIATEQNNDLTENARLFALTMTAMADAGVAAWDSKFVYDFWRPISAVRRADEDGNPDTLADPNWEPLGAPGGIGPNSEVIPDFTPSFPTYVSGHASFGSAMFQSLIQFYGTDDITFSVTSDEVPGVTRTFHRFSDALAENGRSRVYLGIHFDFDDLEARELGRNVANHLATSRFQAVPEPHSVALTLSAALVVLAQARRRGHRDLSLPKSLGSFPG